MEVRYCCLLRCVEHGPEFSSPEPPRPEWTKQTLTPTEHHVHCLVPSPRTRSSGMQSAASPLDAIKYHNDNLRYLIQNLNNPLMVKTRQSVLNTCTLSLSEEIYISDQQKDKDPFQMENTG